MTDLRWGAATDVGRVRTNNEDSLLVEAPLFAVADGVGGHAAGEVASAIAVATLKAAFASQASRDVLADAVRHANEAIFERAREDASLRGMGTTITALALVEEDGDDVLAVVNVGDSRAYRLRDGELEQLTDDHSLVGELVRSGQITSDEAFVHPQRNIVTRALGLDPAVEVDCFGITPFAGDRYLLASDGLTDELVDHDIASVLRRIDDPDDAAQELVHLAKESGGRDNITVIVVDVVDDGDRAVRASASVAATPVQPRPAERHLVDPPADAAPPAAAAPATTQPRERRFTLRAAVFIVALLAVVGGALAAIGFYARGGYYVGIDDATVVIFQGRPGGLLWFDPTVKERTALSEGDVPVAYRDDVVAGKEYGDIEEARQYVRNLEDAAADTTSSTSTTSTTSPSPTMTTALQRP